MIGSLMSGNDCRYIPAKELKVSDILSLHCYLYEVLVAPVAQLINGERANGYVTVVAQMEDADEVSTLTLHQDQYVECRNK
jgi:hypothetical protein